MNSKSKVCLKCSKKYRDIAAFRNHIRTVHGPRRHKCIECAKAFHSTIDLKRHKMVHTGEKPFQCPYKKCGQRFSQATTLNRHIIFQKKEKSYVCSYTGCKKQFLDSFTMRSHFF